MSDKDQALELDMENEVITVERIENVGSAKIIYILYLVGVLFGLSGFIGVIMAYVNKSEGDPALETHYDFQVRTFWIGFIYLIVGFALSFVVVGFFILMFWAVWLVVRSAKGMKYLDQGLPHPNPKGWMFG